MNSVVLQGSHFVPSRPSIGQRIRSSGKKAMIWKAISSIGFGVVFWFWYSSLFPSSPFQAIGSSIPWNPDQAVYQWAGYHRVALP